MPMTPALWKQLFKIYYLRRGTLLLTRKTATSINSEADLIHNEEWRRKVLATVLTVGSEPCPEATQSGSDSSTREVETVGSMSSKPAGHPGLCKQTPS